MALFTQRDTLCERETAEVKADCCESVGDSEEEKKKEFMSVFVCIDDPAYTDSLCVHVCVQMPRRCC